MNKLIQWMLNIVAGIFFFFFFLFLFLPYESIIRGQLSKIPGNYRIHFKEINPHLVFKTELKKFEVFATRQDGTEELLLDFPEVKVGIKYLPLITGRIKGSFVILGKKGREASGHFSFKKNPLLTRGNNTGGSSYFAESIKIKLKNFNLSKIAYLSTWLRPSLKGYVSGNVEINFHPSKFSKNQGGAHLYFKKLILPPRSSLLLGDLPQIALSGKSEGVAKLKVDNGILNIEELKFPGEDLVVNLKGNVILSKKFDRSRLRLDGEYKFSEALSKVVNTVGQLLPHFSEIEEQKTSEGFYPLTLQGRLTAPQILIGDFNLNDELAKVGIKF